jgi:hypothetical protein
MGCAWTARDSVRRWTVLRWERVCYFFVGTFRGASPNNTCSFFVFNATESLGQSGHICEAVTVTGFESLGQLKKQPSRVNPASKR